MKAKAMARAPSPLGRRDALAMPPPYTAIPASAKRLPPMAKGKPPPPSPDTLVTSPPGVQAVGARGPDFGGSYTRESSAGFVFTSYRAPVGPMGRSVKMLAAEVSDRDLKTFPRTAFDRLPLTDPPALRVIGGVKGPGWFSRLQTEDQWHGSLYKINTGLKCYDFGLRSCVWLQASRVCAANRSR